MSEHVRCTHDDGIAWVLLDRPAKKNAIDAPMFRRLAALFAELADDDAVRVVHWSGAGGCFTAGLDLVAFSGDGEIDASPALDFLAVLSTFPKPLVIAVDGLGIGIGTTALLHADLVFASDRARFKVPFVDLGLVPEAASSLLMPRLMGHAKASRWLLLGEMFGAVDAEAMGLVGQVVPAAELDAVSGDAARGLAAKPPAALRKSKALMKRAPADAIAEAMRIEAEVFDACLKGPEAAAAFAAFANRR